MIKDLSLLSFDKNEKANITFNPSRPAITGRKRLIQQIIKLIFTKSGSDSFNPDIGTNFTDLFSTITLDEVDSAEQAFPIMVKNLEQQIKQRQMNYEIENGVLPDNEKLEALHLDNAEFDRQIGGWTLDLRVVTANNEFSISVP